jgi:hypothetical protein
MQPMQPERRNAYSVRFLVEPGLHCKVPGLFVSYAPLAK